MPFPLAHPAAVLPLRCLCPRYLSFPALVIGSLIPDLGYAFRTPKFGHAFAHPNLDVYTHEFWPGSFMLSLPAGLVVLWLFHLVRRSAVSLLPAPYREFVLPLCQGPMGSPLGIAVSVLLGSWTHLFLDSMTNRFQTYGMLYAAFTFAGVAWLAAAYLRWLVGVARVSVQSTRGVRQRAALLLASATLCVVQANREPFNAIGMATAGIDTFLLVICFLAITGRVFRKTRV